jgi:hypothetical protein
VKWKNVDIGCDLNFGVFGYRTVFLYDDDDDHHHHHLLLRFCTYGMKAGICNEQASKPLR